MITIKKLMLVSVLLATAVNTFATTRLSSIFNVPEGASVLVILFLLPSVSGATPAVCKSVKVLPVIGDADGSVSITSDPADGVFELKLTHLTPVTLEQYQGTKFAVPNAGPGAKNYGLEFEVVPAEAAACNLRASAQVILPDGTPAGAPFNLADSFKPTTKDLNPRPR